MAVFRQTCPGCGRTIARSARFCPDCGAPQPTAKVTCGNCGREVPASAAFCPYCGRPAESARPPEIADNRWRRHEEDFASRILVDDVRGLFARELIVEPGTQAIILADGANLGVVGPGKYTLDTLGERAEVFLQLRTAHRMEAILVDVADTDLTFRVPHLFTSDPVPVDLVCRVVARLGNPVLFLQTVMKAQRRYGLDRLQDYLYTEVQGAAQEWMSGHGVSELATNLRLRDELEVALGAYLRRTLERTGLELVQVRAMDFAHEYLDRVTGERADLFLQMAEEEAKLEGKRRLLDVLTQRQLQELAEETANVEQHERRAAVWSRMRQSILSDRMDEVRTEDQLEAFLREQDKQKLVRDKEYADLKRTFAEEQEDHELQRRYVQRKIEVEWQKELDRIALLGETDLLEIRLKRRDTELRAQLEAERLEALERKKTEVEVRQHELEIALQEAKTRAQVTAIEREQEKLDGELGVYLLELMDARRLSKQHQKMVLEAEREEKDLERRLREDRARHEAEMERLEKLGQVSAEVLVSVSGPEQARVLAEMKRTETLAGMSEEQILALAAERSPEVARAFQEKFRALSAEQQTEMYQRMLKDREAAAEQLAEALREAARMQQETAFRAMETQRDISVAYAQARGESPLVIVPGTGAAVSAAAPGTAGRVVVCPRCHQESPVGVKYCQSCGHQFFATGEGD